MRSSIKKEFGKLRPRAIVLDDHAGTRRMTARSLRTRGFDVLEYGSPAEFYRNWHPGMVDVIVADWNLSGDIMQSGDHVLSEVRKRDWDVPFVLVSGKLDETTERAKTLERLLKSGSARFVRRGSSGIRTACDEAENLIERRDLALLKVILSLRKGALEGATIKTTSGEQSAAQLLEGVVARPTSSHDAGRPVAQARARRTGFVTDQS